jgi:hypothetical protein
MCTLAKTMGEENVPNEAEEIFVSLIVVRRPERAGNETINPGEWAQSVLESLRTEGPQHTGTSRRGSTLRGSDLASAAYSQRNTHIHKRVPQGYRRWLLSLSAACCVGAVYCFYLAVQSQV